MHTLLDHRWLSLRGPDARRYLQGQLTADLRTLEPGHWLPACLCDHKGALQAVLGVRPLADRDEFWLDLPAELFEAATQRLDRYLIADDAELEPLEPQPALVHLLASPGSDPLPSAQELAAALDGQLAAEAVAARRFGVEGFDLPVLPERLDDCLEILEQRFGHGPLADSELDELRLETMTPIWGAELVPGILAPEGGLGAPAVSLDKGCYLGQEVLSRIKSVGRARSVLARVKRSDGEALELGAHFVAEPQAEARSLGRITTISADGQRALGRLKRSAADSGGALWARGGSVEKPLFSSLALDHSVEPFAR